MSLPLMICTPFVGFWLCSAPQPLFPLSRFDYEWCHATGKRSTSLACLSGAFFCPSGKPVSDGCQLKGLDYQTRDVTFAFLRK
ncbi:hypothetical protein BC826DRAFT_1035960 [Russula brevipes]|nr:hypothetical protein BC826DRAFT_1035960 [Russula brevipes]